MTTTTEVTPSLFQRVYQERRAEREREESSRQRKLYRFKPKRAKSKAHEANRAAKKATAQRKKDALNRLKVSRGCDRCGSNGLPAHAYDLHHRDPTLKLFEPTQLQSRSWEEWRVEVAKCDVLCATCHRIVEYGDK